MADPHPFLVGRVVATLPVLAILTFVFSYLVWYATIDTDHCGVAVPELLVVGFVVTSACVLSPRMATWEALAVPQVRRLAAVIAGAVLAVSAVTPMLLFLAVTRLPRGVVPRSGSFALDEIDAHVWFPLVANVMIVGSIAMIGVAHLGRVIGTVVSIATHAVLFWLSSTTKAMTPYTALCSTETGAPVWFPAVALSITALVIWYRTGGSTPLAQRFDPRS